ncbi:hypothetical protein ZHAS_00013132 [Anopheles sinensis]|uniref:Uncharacterized protein n=1 Tax=Anopheles sinensis TaxID=74873 RepID=A0A084W4M9_ANOSI|nr:hypothetical protein ZHAS_00013132 [Anopheles sinensis]
MSRSIWMQHDDLAAKPNRVALQLQQNREPSDFLLAHATRVEEWLRPAIAIASTPLSCFRVCFDYLAAVASEGSCLDLFHFASRATLPAQSKS